MATYPPPTETLPTFNSTVFTSPLTDGLTVAEADLRYLKFPSSQGGETINGNLVVSGTTTVDTIAGSAVGTAVSLYNEASRTGAISIGAGGTGSRIITINRSGGGNTNINGWTIVGSNNILNTTGDIQIDTTGGAGRGLYLGSSISTGPVYIGNAMTSGTIFIGNGASQTGAINIGTGNTTSSLPITIGNQSGAFGSVDIGTTTITVGKSNTATNNIQTSTSGTLNLKTTSTGGAINMGTGMTSGTINIGRTDATASTTTISIATGSSQTGAIDIGTGSSNKDITIGSVLSTGNSTFIRGKTVAINPKVDDGTLNLGQAMTGGSIFLGGTTGGTNTLTIQRPIQLSSGADPASSTSAIGYIYPIITATSVAIAVPANTYTWSTGARSLGIGVWMLSLGATILADFTPQNYVYNMGFMSSAPVVADSATASSPPANTIANINGNTRDDDAINLDNGTYIYNIGGVVVNNYGGTFNNVYGIFNADWSVAGTIEMLALSIRAVKIG